MVVLQLVAAMVEMIGNARQTGTCLADTFVNLPKKISFSHQQDLCYSQTERNFKPKSNVWIGVPSFLSASNKF